MSGKYPYFKKLSIYEQNNTTLTSTTSSGTITTNNWLTNVKCPKCGKFDPTYPIVSSGYAFSTPICSCKEEETKKQENMGWICPICGRGNAPHNMTCDCVTK